MNRDDEDQDGSNAESAATDEPLEQPQNRSTAATALMDPGLWDRLRAHLRKQRGETGGLLLGYRVDDLPRFAAAVLPEQLMSSSVRCEFSATEIYRMRNALDDLADTVDADVDSLSIFSWVHTHPGLGVFLSGTDRSTLAEWAAVDPSLHVVVIDAFKDSLKDQIGVFDCDGRPVPVSLEAVDVPTELLDGLAQAVGSAYADSGLPSPHLVIGDGFAAEDGISDSAAEELEEETEVGNDG